MDVRSVRRLAGAAAAALFVFLLTTGSAHAENGMDLTIPVGPAAVVRMQMRSGTLTVRTWDQQQVHITSNVPVDAQRFGPTAVQNQLRGGDIPIFETSVQTPSGQLKLPPEEFTVSSLASGTHDGVAIFGGDSGASVTLTIPASTALILATIGRGGMQLQDYHGGSFIGRVHNGTIRVENVSGEGYLEVARGRIVAANSTFDRIRARTAAGNIVFQHCTSRQIEVSSIDGNVVYDDGTFAPGLARLESQNGNVAVGVGGGGAQIGAHSASGKLFEGFNQPADIRGSSTDAQATVNGGGPVVTVSSERGSVYLYNGARAQAGAGGNWRPIGRPAAPGHPIRKRPRPRIIP